jgi:hypothetical protein
MSPVKWMPAALAALAIAACSLGAQAHESGRVIQREQLEEMFAGMRAKAPWNVDGPLLWGYFFNSPEKGALEKTALEKSST